MHPNSPALEVHANKVGTTPQGLRMKIAETIRLLKNANTNNNNLTILGHNYYNTMSVFISGESAIVTPYFLARVRRTPPILTFADTGRRALL